MSIADNADRYKVMRDEVVANFATYKPILDRVCAHIQSELPQMPIHHDKTETNTCGQTSICNFIDDLMNLVLTADNEADAFRKLWCLFHGEKITKAKSNEIEIAEMYREAARMAIDSATIWRDKCAKTEVDIAEMKKVRIN